MPDEKVIINIDHTGNMSGASIPVAIAEAQGRFAPGEKMLLAAFGAGFTYGAAVVTW
jgi:3-oxoacyl-[acyl-carrier-protein] synthase-3